MVGKNLSNSYRTSRSQIWTNPTELFLVEFLQRRFLMNRRDIILVPRWRPRAVFIESIFNVSSTFLCLLNLILSYLIHWKTQETVLHFLGLINVQLNFGSCFRFMAMDFSQEGNNICWIGLMILLSKNKVKFLSSGRQFGIYKTTSSGVWTT